MRLPTATRLAGLLMPLFAAGTVSAQTAPAAPAPPRLDGRTAPTAAAAAEASASAPSGTPVPARPAAVPHACTPDAATTARRDARAAVAPLPRVVERLPGAPADEATRGEPAVECLVTTDADGTRIEELRVRGRTERLVVHPKDGGRPYEIQLMDAGRDPGAKSGPGRGGAGQRVWPVLAF